MSILFRLFLIIRKVVYLSLGGADAAMGRGSGSVFVLAYHSVSGDGWRFAVDFEVLKKQVMYLKEHFDFIGLSDLREFILGRRVLRRASVVITFDDGYKDVLQTREFFREQKISPGLFLLADTSNADYEELGTRREFLSRDEVLLLVKEGWEVGSHSRTHPNLKLLSEGEVGEEVSGSKRLLEEWLGVPVPYFAYPRGKYSGLVLDCVRSGGYKLGLTMDDGAIGIGSDLFRIPRVGVDRTHSFEEFKVSYSPTVVGFRSLVKKWLGFVYE